MNLTENQRYFLAGFLTAQSGIEGGTTPARVLSRITETPQAEFDQTVMPLVVLASDQFQKVDQARLNNLDSGLNFNKQINEWTHEEWRCAITSICLYRYYLERELNCINDIIDSDPILKTDLQQIPRDIRLIEMRENGVRNLPMVDTTWAARLIRKIANSLIATHKAMTVPL
jgi:hypothetical protein